LEYIKIDKQFIIAISPKLTKVMVSGFIKSNDSLSIGLKIKTDLFHLDFADQKFKKLYFPNVIRQPE